MDFIMKMIKSVRQSDTGCISQNFSDRRSRVELVRLSPPIQTVFLSAENPL